MRGRISTTWGTLARGMGLSLWALFPMSGGTSEGVPNDSPYFTSDTDRTERIYTSQNKPFAERAATLEGPLLDEYQSSFGWTLDEKLHLGWMSDRNQLANGFSTPLPNNRQIHFGGGTLLVDYFSSRSWVETLLYHETAHSFQLDVKDNPISGSLHRVTKNGFVLWPFATLPNIAVSPFFLEGNAVLNESWHGNGGRLYSGRFWAQTLMQVRAGYFTPERMHNATLHFPYGEHFYSMGGWLMYDLAKTRGLDRVNSFFKIHSRDWFFPFFTNDRMFEAVGTDFEGAVGDFVSRATPEARALVEARGTVLTRSKFFHPLNSDEGEVYFTVEKEGVRSPELVRWDRRARTLLARRGGFLSGKVIKHGGRFWTQGEAYISPTRFEQGLYDDRGRIMKGSESKMIQGYMRDGSPVYFDVPSSFDHPRLFVDGRFYADVHSSVFIDGRDHLYYFVQEGKVRTLMRDKEPLTSLRGFYGYVCDVDRKGNVYFISNSIRGSTLFRWTTDNTVERMCAADNVLDARLASDTELILAAVGADDYYYCLSPMEQPLADRPYEMVLFFEKDPSYGRVADRAKEHPVSLNEDRPYRPLLDMNYSGTTVMYAASDSGPLYEVSALFADPLTRNSVTGFVSRGDEEVTVGGVSYENSQTILDFSLAGFGVAARDKNNSPDIARSGGVSAAADVPLLKEGYWSSKVATSYSQDYESKAREPWGVVVSLKNQQRFGLSWPDNRRFYLDGFATLDRGDGAIGGTLDLFRDAPREWYGGIFGKTAYSDLRQSDGGSRRGIKIESHPSEFDRDPSKITMPSLRDTSYVKGVTKGSVGIHKIIHVQKYFFTFPVSVRRQHLYAVFNHYAIDAFHRTDTVREITCGLTVDVLLFGVLPVPVDVQYNNNDNPRYADSDTWRMTLMARF